MMRRRNVATKTSRALLASRLLPFMTVAGVCSFVDQRNALSLPPKTKKTTSSDCVSTTALLVFRGFGAGMAWTIGVDGYALASMTDDEWKKRITSLPGSSDGRKAARLLLRLSARNILGFASFLGIFGGVSCALEKARGKNDLLNPFIGGFTAGMAILPSELRNPRTIVTSALLCGSASMALHYFIPSGEI